jgi:hypothetical protein
MKLTKILTLVIIFGVANISAMEGNDNWDTPLKRTHRNIKQCDQIMTQKQNTITQQELDSVFHVLKEIDKIDFKNMLLENICEDVLASEVVSMIPNLCKKISLVASTQCDDLKLESKVICKKLEKIQFNILCKRVYRNDDLGKPFVEKKESSFWDSLFGNSKNGYKLLKLD